MLIGVQTREDVVRQVLQDLEDYFAQAEEMEDQETLNFSVSERVADFYTYQYHKD